MEGAQRGKLILKAVPDGEVKRNVAIYLSTLMTNVSPELLAAKITRTPLILSKNITIEQGLKIVADLELTVAYSLRSYLPSLRNLQDSTLSLCRWFSPEARAVRFTIIDTPEWVSYPKRYDSCEMLTKV